MTIFETEKRTIEQAQALLNDEQHQQNPLLAAYSTLLNDYRRMYKQLRHVINVSDNQQLRLSELNHALKDSNASKDKFFSIIAHDLRGPLASLIGLSEVLQEQIEADVSKQTLSHSVDVMYASTKNLYTLLENLLTWSRIRRGAIESRPENLELAEIAKFIIRLFWSQAQQKQLQFLYTVSEDLVVSADYNMVSTVLRNLVSNAIKFTPCGGTIEISAALSDNGLIEVAVSDTGVGIPEEDFPKLFRFDQEYTNIGTAGERGTGLGLNLCKEFVEKNGQTLWVESEVKKGTTFRFTLAPTCSQKDSPISPVMAIEPNGVTHDFSQYRMLVVDDVPANRQFLINLLSPFGFRFREANNGQEAIDIWEHWHPHLIWMDIRMPVMNGYDAARQIKTSTNGKGTTIIALTASISEDEYATVFAVGYDNLLRKPFKETDIFNMIQCYLGVSLNVERGKSQAKEGSTQDDIKTVLTPEAIAALPEAWRDDLLYVAKVFELSMAKELIQRIREDNQPLADALETLVYNYEFERLRELCEQAEGGKQ